MEQGRIMKARGTDSPGGRHPNRTNGAPTPTTPPRFFYKPDALPAAHGTNSVIALKASV